MAEGVVGEVCVVSVEGVEKGGQCSAGWKRKGGMSGGGKETGPWWSGTSAEVLVVGKEEGAFQYVEKNGRGISENKTEKELRTECRREGKDLGGKKESRRKGVPVLLLLFRLVNKRGKEKKTLPKVQCSFIGLLCRKPPS